jgi:hypothetical protein
MSLDNDKVSDGVSLLGLELSSDLKAAAEFWREFDLDSKRQDLKKQCMEMIEAKSASNNGKKRLNEITKSFRAKPSVSACRCLALCRLGLINKLINVLLLL